ncbi:hypothetical protein EYF80_022968 [Liparis tanakae]|uniref:Uncharacterized protein n=1 Tax=Liparis tanakae TaxID=230148 RepID=A0A4Z2HLM4_9TELE|nr:hypothetical protein EYF80_022968 [Liparis tanakae]
MKAADGLIRSEENGVRCGGNEACRVPESRDRGADSLHVVNVGFWEFWSEARAVVPGAQIAVEVDGIVSNQSLDLLIFTF